MVLVVLLLILPWGTQWLKQFHSYHMKSNTFGLYQHQQTVRINTNLSTTNNHTILIYNSTQNLTIRNPASHYTTNTKSSLITHPNHPHCFPKPKHHHHTSTLSWLSKHKNLGTYISISSHCLKSSNTQDLQLINATVFGCNSPKMTTDQLKNPPSLTCLLLFLQEQKTSSSYYCICKVWY